MRGNLNNIKITRKGDEVLIFQGDKEIAAMTADYAIDMADIMMSHADKILASTGDLSE